MIQARKIRSENRFNPKRFRSKLRAMSALSGSRGESLAPTQLSFDNAFRERLRDLLVWRRDVRRFRREALPDGALEALIELACLAPSVGLSQPWRFVIVDDEATRAAIQCNFEACNAAALADQSPQRANRYARLKLAGYGPARFVISLKSNDAALRFQLLHTIEAGL